MYNIIIDTREQIPLDFSENQNCKACITRKLDTGDYTIEGYEDKLIIERKHSVSEIAFNLGLDKKRFEKELERMQGKMAYIVCEFSIDDIIKFPKGSKIPSKLLKSVNMTGRVVFKKLCELQEKYKIKVLYCRDEIGATEKITEIMDEFYEMVR